jgi:DNA-binding response OmpR family regulator
MTARILVVDDEPNIVKLVTATLKARGYTTYEAFDGHEAIVLAKLHKPDLILLDVMMPRMDGRETRKRLLEDPDTKSIPVVHLTAVGDFEQQRKALSEGAVDYIVKPFAPAELGDRVAELLDPTKKDQVAREHNKKEGQMRTIVDIMHRGDKQ